MPVPGETLRRGLPRRPGGDRWPVVPTTALPAPNDLRAAAEHDATPYRASSAESAGGVRVRRGLPRASGGPPWPEVDAGATPLASESRIETTDREVTPTATAAAPTAAAVTPAATAAAPSVQPLVPRATAGASSTASVRGSYGPFTLLQLIGISLVGGLALLLVGTLVVAASRWFMSLPAIQELLLAYPGAYDLPDGAPVGFPAWMRWQHFLNAFLILLIIRSGLSVRRDQRPKAFWTPRWASSTGKVSLTSWLHQTLDLLWLFNGAVFVVMLFSTGQWVRIVPTSWDVLPNAISAALQYASLDWPTEHGWVNYNALQQLAYFMTVFIAAPLAAASGYRMSSIWPTRLQRLSRAVPIEWARAVHFPVMLYFVAFIAAHVSLVLATGALRNLNHMYAGADVVSWTGFWLFVASLCAMAAGWSLARPLLLAPVAKLMGTVTSR